MTVKHLLLKSGENLISDVKELVSDEKVCGYLLVDPQKLLVEQPFLFQDNPTEETQSEIKISMSPWIFLSKDREIVIKPDWVVTVTEPIDSVKMMYKEKINARNDNQSTDIDQSASSDNSN